MITNCEFEIWTMAQSAGVPEPPYVLVVIIESASGSVRIYDPQIKQWIGQFNNYQESVDWLCDDEFEQVDGRMSLE